MVLRPATVTIHRQRGLVMLRVRGGSGWPAGPLQDVADCAAIARALEGERRRARELVRDCALAAVRAGVSQAEVARAAGVSRQAMHELLADR